MKLLANNNHKLKGMLVYSHTPIQGCLDCKSCKDTCYSVKAYRQYKDTRAAWDRHLDMALNNIPLMEELLDKQLSKTKTYTVRVHSSGDFVSQDYLNMWGRVAKKYPHINFYTYTKSRHRFDFAPLDNLSNFNVLDSMVKGKFRNYGNRQYVDNLVEKHGCKLCPATVDKNVKCGEGNKEGITYCDYCVKGKNVVFLQH